MDQNSSNTYGDGIPKPNFDLETGTNRLYGAGDLALGESSRSMRYDAAGNLWKDTYSAAAVTRLYDAENRMTKETQASSYVAGEYSYDGDGRRVKRKVGSVETWQVYGLGGELIAVYAAGAPASSPQKEYGYRNGQLLVTLTSPLPGGSPSFSDNPILVGVTVVKAAHIAELRTAINNLRAHLGMSSYSWTTSATTNDYISAAPIAEMRTALDQALGVPAGGYTSGLVSGLPVKAIHIQELRDRLTAASGSDVRWMVTDQLGTPRMIFDQSGSLATTVRHDYLPFSEELAGTGGRTTAQGYSASDGIRQHFTQKERDIETGLDYFGARYFASIQGRFTGADPLLGSGNVDSPQSWNRYSYVLNNPLRFIDPDGLYVFDSHVSDDDREKFRAAMHRARVDLWKIGAKYGVSSNEFQKARRALDAYGDEGKKNGVTVFIKPGEGGGETVGVKGQVGPDNPTGQQITVTFHARQFHSATFEEDIGHEGSHAADAEDWAKSRFDRSREVTDYQTEMDGYMVQSLFEQGAQPHGDRAFKFPGFNNPQGRGQHVWPPLTIYLYKSSWNEADKATVRAERRSNIDTWVTLPKYAGGMYAHLSTSKRPAF